MESTYKSLRLEDISKDKTTVEKLGNHWEYVYTVAEAYNGLLESEVSFTRINSINPKQKLNHPRIIYQRKRDFSAKLYAFFLTCRYHFSEYLAKDEFKKDFPEESQIITVRSYKSLAQAEISDKELYMLMDIITLWVQKYGWFRTMNTYRDPHFAIMGRGG